ncbi:CASP-like protein 2C1 [Andrographis paniculata]|uniref:CASP-like protein 2C1 n=1 Tax=Andrographis paniculata TaxID=175694 RepID=UPI0021E73CA7|nr:CASP-like protein 2C1 [Andrographis paniculata]
MVVMEVLKVESILRVFAAIVFVITACLVGFDRQTKLLFGVLTRTATFRDLNALYAVVWIDSVAAAYNVMQVLRSYLLPVSMESPSYTHRYFAWGIYFLDQIIAYIVFAGNTAAMQGSMLAVTGEKSFGWMKVCDKFTRFCAQIGGGLFCGYIAAATMAVISSISAYSLFRIYSSKYLLVLKPK